MCPLCKSDALIRTSDGTIEEPVTLIRCSACGFSWREWIYRMNDKNIKFIKIIGNGN